MKNKRKYHILLIIPLIFLILGFLHIGTALAGLACLLMPFLLLLGKKKRIWCTSVCPRSHWLEWGGKWGKGKNPPPGLVNKKVRSAVLTYFEVNLLFAAMSTIMVGIGRMPPMDIVRLFIAIPLTSLPQISTAYPLPPVLLHLAYRAYSIMFSSFLAGTVLALLYKPRTWCAVCPINSMIRNLDSPTRQGW